MSQLWAGFQRRISDTRELSALKVLDARPASQVFRYSYNPFMWMARWLNGILGGSPLLTLLLLSNALLLLFLGELNALFNRMATPDVASAATILVILWPTSYELSLGSSFTLSCFLATLAIRGALDNQWLFSGLALAVLGLAEPLVVGLLPIILFIFWYFQRHFRGPQMLRRGALFLTPLVIAMAWAYQNLMTIHAQVVDSALLNLYQGLVSGKGLGWTFSRSYAGQTLSIIFFTIGAVAAFFSNTTVVHRMIPANMLLVLLLFSPYGAVASRAPLAAVCFEGITSASAGMVLRLLQILMLCLGLFEVGAVFRM